MTEEIIIDGVNVAGCHNKTPYKNDYGDVQCKSYRFEDIENDTFLLGICKQHPNCYYKQLKRLEQERDELKKTVENQRLEYEELQCDLSEVENTCGCYQSENAELKQENKKLKKDVQLFKCLDTFGESECHCACRCLGNEFCEDADKKINNYRSALEEINITVKQLLQGVTSNCINNTPYLIALSLIETKINEVLNG